MKNKNIRVELYWEFDNGFRVIYKDMEFKSADIADKYISTMLTEMVAKNKRNNSLGRPCPVSIALRKTVNRVLTENNYSL
jgi:hypothetical protein